jgi:hypothetical protein
MRKALLTLAGLALGSTAAPAQQGWAEKMFTQGVTHDFGGVAYGAQLLHRFTITNIYAVRMEITSIKIGCGCVTAEPLKRVLDSRESTEIEVRMDTRRFKGPKTVGIRVSVGPEFISSAELRVSANSRPDIVFNPGEVNFGTVVRGSAAVQTIDVEYAGALDWRVSEVVSRELPIDVSFKELYRQPGKVGYQVRVALKADAPAGPVKGDVFLRTNDPASPLVAVLVEANVQAALTVSPATFALGTVKAGDTLTRRVVVRGSRSFLVRSVDSSGDGIALDPLPITPATVQIITFKCQIAKAGEFKRQLRIKTDMQEAPAIVTIEGNAMP